MMLITTCFIIILLAIIVWQDFMYRAIYWFLLPGLTICFILKTYFEGTLHILDIVANLSVIGVQVGLLSIYVFSKNKKWELYRHYLGLGDVLFFCALAFYFSTPLFLGFQIFSLLTTLVCFTVVMKLTNKTSTIPLAGCQAAVLILLITSQSILDISDADIDRWLSDNILGYEH